MKLRKEVPLERIFQGTKAHPPTTAVMICPRVMLMYCENKAWLALSEFAELEKGAYLWEQRGQVVGG